MNNYYHPEEIRNVGICSHGGAGKTSLTEALLYNAGTIDRLGSVDQGNTVTNSDQEEVDRQVTINTSVAPCEWKDKKLNLVDTPGYFDFIGDLKSSLRIVDGALIVVCASSGVQVGTEQVWDFANEFHLPRLMFINKIERENASYDKTFTNLREKFGEQVVPVSVPMGSESEFQGIINLVTMKAEYCAGSQSSTEIPSEYVELAEYYRELLLESVAECDDELLEQYLEGNTLSEDDLISGIKKFSQSGHLVPVLCGSSLLNVGVSLLLDCLTYYIPSPIEHELHGMSSDSGEELTLETDPEAPFCAFVFKTVSDPYLGRLNYFRVFSGQIKDEDELYNSSKKTKEKLGKMYYLKGKEQITTGQVSVGDIAAVSKLEQTATGDTLSQKDMPIVLAGVDYPEPVISCSVIANDKGEEEKLGTSLAKLLEEDPILKLEKDEQTKETLISGMGELQLEIIINRMQKKYGVNVELNTPQIPYKETITTKVTAEEKYKKQSGGRGQYGHVIMELSPQSRGRGFEFENNIVGGVIPRTYIPSVEKGVQEAMESGALAGYPVVDVKVNLYDGSHHSVDSSEMAFKIAGSTAFKKGMEQAKPILLEPILEVEVLVPEDLMGDVMGDLNSKRGKILGMDPDGSYQLIKAYVPQSEMLRYAVDLRSITQGRGSFNTEFSHYEQVPDDVAQEIIAELSTDVS